MSSADATDPEVAYFRDIERAFVEKRGDPLFISNADWVYLAKLRKKNVPQRVVLRGITDALDAHAHSFSRGRKVRSLKFCEPQINAAVDRHRRALHIDGAGPRSVVPALERMETALAAAPPGPPMAEAVTSARTDLRGLAQAFRDDRTLDLEKALSRIEDAIFRTAAATLEATVVTEIERSTREATAAYQSRMPVKVYETLIEESVRRRVLQRFGLPRLLLAEFE